MIVLLAVIIDEAEVDEVFAAETTPEARTRALVDCARTKPVYRHWEFSNRDENTIAAMLSDLYF